MERPARRRLASPFPFLTACVLWYVFLAHRDMKKRAKQAFVLKMRYGSKWAGRLICWLGLMTAGCGDRIHSRDRYLIIDLSAGPEATAYPVFSRDTLPAGGWPKEYKTTRMVFRHIPPGSAVLGSPENECGRYAHEKQRTVRIRRPFYIGVFPVTQRQWYHVMGTWPSFFSHPRFRDTRPVERVKYTEIRGEKAGAQWPANAEVDLDSFMGRLRARTGLFFDLPTEAQWEYAARAGTKAALHSGKPLTNEERCIHLSALARYGHNGTFNPAADVSEGTAPVGSYPPNGWGLYDVQGNVWEWCRDWYSPNPGSGTDPAGRRQGKYRVMRGGSWVSIARHCRLAHRHSSVPTFAGSADGFRVVLVPDLSR